MLGSTAGETPDLDGILIYFLKTIQKLYTHFDDIINTDVSIQFMTVSVRSRGSTLASQTSVQSREVNKKIQI